MLTKSSKYTKKLAVILISKTNIIANIIDNGIDITMITQVLDNDATFWVAASAPKAA